MDDSTEGARREDRHRFWCECESGLAQRCCSQQHSGWAETVGDTYATPLHCAAIAARQDTAEARHKELLTLMERSGAGVGGRTINTFVYGPDLNNVERELQALQQTAAEKNCPAH
jgi:hypothetical protein